MNRILIVAASALAISLAGLRQFEEPAQDPGDTAKRVAALETLIVPVGGVLLWWGAESELPPGFEVCDGSVPVTKGALLKERKPDLRDRFAKGPKDPASFRPRVAQTGGQNELARQLTLEHALTANELPGHTHPIPHTHTIGAHTHTIQPHVHPTGDHVHLLGRWLTLHDGGGSAVEVLSRDVSGTDTSGVPLPGTSNGRSPVLTTDSAPGASTGGPTRPDSGQNTPSGAGHVHAIPAIDNRPEFQELLYVIRVK